MSLTLELGPDLEGWLRTQAAARGVPVQEYVEGLIREAANGSFPERPGLAEFQADWEAFAEGLDHIPPLPPEALSREAMYSERQARCP